MPIAIVLRKKLAVNLFRDALISALNSGDVTEAVVASGFFQEGRGGYNASLEYGLISSLKNNNIIFHALGVYSGYWAPEFKAFVNALKTAGVRTQGWQKSGFHWHAKIAILLKNNRPVFAIIGSSNMTSRAFGVGSGGVNPSSLIPPKLFNFECDTILWEDDVISLNSAVESVFESQDVVDSVIRAPYMPELNGGVALDRRLSDLLREISSTGIVPI